MTRERYSPEPEHGDLEGLTDNDHTQYVNSVTDSASIDFTLAGQDITGIVKPAGVHHGGLAGLGDDDHTQYALLAGRSGGQILRGGTDAGDDLTVRSTSHGTKGTVIADGEIVRMKRLLAGGVTE